MLLLLLLLRGSGHAQADSTYLWHLKAQVHQGVLLPEYGFMDYLARDYIRGFEVSIARRTLGKKLWEQLYGYPVWGITFFYSSMGNREVFGNQFTLFPYFVSHIMGKGPLSLDGQMGLGIAYTTKKFDLQQNPLNIAIGSHLNIHFRTELMARLRFSPRNHLHLGIAFHHISNANLSEPNVGLNFASLGTGVWHAVGSKQPVTHQAVPRHKAHLSLEAMVSGGVKHTRTFESFRYATASTSLGMKFRWCHRFAVGTGADFFYDASVEDQMRRLGKPFLPHYAWMSGIHLAQEVIVGRTSFILQQGAYLGLLQRLNGYKFYNRFLARHHLTDHFFANLSLKSHLVMLDFPELGLGFDW